MCICSLRVCVCVRESVCCLHGNIADICRCVCVRVCVIQWQTICSCLAHTHTHMRVHPPDSCCNAIFSLCLSPSLYSTFFCNASSCLLETTKTMRQCSHPIGYQQAWSTLATLSALPRLAWPGLPAPNCFPLFLFFLLPCGFSLLRQHSSGSGVRGNP